MRILKALCFIDTTVRYLTQILHHIKQFEKIISKEKKKPNTLFFLKLHSNTKRSTR